MSYKDPNRKIGSQSEIPTIIINDDLLTINGYQVFNIYLPEKHLEFIAKPIKFNHISHILCKLNIEEKCNTICDIGCNSGLCSLIAHNNNFTEIVSLDHDSEYINIIGTIKELCGITNIHEKVFSFGDNINKKFDIVFCGALIHWIYSLTADFRNFDKIIEYLLGFTNNYILIEWVEPHDPAITWFNHISKNALDTDEVYSTENFEKSINKYMKLISKQQIDGDTRWLYILQIL